MSSLPASDRELIEQLKKQLNTTTQQLNVTSQQLVVTSERLQLSELRVQLLKEKLRLQRIAKYGPGSEKLTSPQLELLELSHSPRTAPPDARSPHGCDDLPTPLLPHS